MLAKHPNLLLKNKIWKNLNWQDRPFMIWEQKFNFSTICVNILDFDVWFAKNLYATNWLTYVLNFNVCLWHFLKGTKKNLYVVTITEKNKRIHYSTFTNLFLQLYITAHQFYPLLQSLSWRKLRRFLSVPEFMCLPSNLWRKKVKTWKNSSPKSKRSLQPSEVFEWFISTLNIFSIVFWSRQYYKFCSKF